VTTQPTYVTAVHKTRNMSRGRLPVSDTLEMTQEKIKCFQTRPFMGSTMTSESSQDIATGIPNF
jgi:hypothetical protein